jgi:hypothetical protein
MEPFCEGAAAQGTTEFSVAYPHKQMTVFIPARGMARMNLDPGSLPGMTVFIPLRGTATVSS